MVGINGLLNNYSQHPNCPKKVLIVDWDVHHGNGTQQLSYNKNNILYFSVHRYANNLSFFPGTGNINEIGEEVDSKTDKKDSEENIKENENESKISLDMNNNNSYDGTSPLGKNINVTLDKKMGDFEYLLIWRDILIPIAKKFQPDLIIISAGFDACMGDPLGEMRVTPPTYGVLTKQLLEIQNNLVMLLEGGYNLETMPKAICCCVHALLTTNNDNDNKNNNIGSIETKHECMRPLLSVVNKIHWKKKMHASFELTDDDSCSKWTYNQLKLIEISFNYINGCLECIKKWSNANNKDKNIDISIKFHKEWMKYYDRINDVAKRGGGTLHIKGSEYACQIPKSNRIYQIIQSVLNIHVKYWPCLTQLAKKYNDICVSSKVDQLKLSELNLKVS